MFTKETRTGDIVTKVPKASLLFKKYKIDYCCGGNRAIGAVLQEKNLPLTLIDDLNQMYESKQNQPTEKWEQFNEGEIVDIVLAKFHKPSYQLLEELTGLIDKIVKVHGVNHPYLMQVQMIFADINHEMLTHFQKEEMTLFSHIKHYCLTKSSEEREMVKAMIMQMEVEHSEVGELLYKIRDAANDYQVPVDACHTYRLAYLKLEELESLTFDHVHTENNILFQRIN